MAINYDSKYFYDSILDACRLTATSLPAGTQATILKIMNMVLISDVIPTILSYREEYYLRSITFSADSEYFRLPTYVIGSKIRGAYVLDENGNIIRDLPVLNPDSSNQFYYAAYLLSYRSVPGIEMKDNVIYTNIRGYTIQLKYYRNHNDLIYFDASTPGTNALLISAVNTTTKTLTITNPGALALSLYPEIIAGDWIFERKPCEIDSIASTTSCTYSGDNLINVNDWIFKTKETGFVNIPREAMEYYITACALRVLNRIGAIVEYRDMVGTYQKAREDLAMLLDPRDDGQPHTITDSRGFFDYA